MELNTDRLLLRPYAEEDRAAFVALNGDPIVRRRMNGPLRAEAANALFDRIRSEFRLAWAVFDKTEVQYAGHVFVNVDGDLPDPELGFLLARRYWRRGLATEAALRVVAYVFDTTSFGRLLATADTDNLASIRVLEKSGFERIEERSDEDGPYYVYALERAGETGGRHAP